MTEINRRLQPETTMAGHLTKPLSYEDVIQIGMSALAEDEFWCIYHPDGPLPDTAAKRLDAPVRLICNAMDAEWDDLTEQGYRLGKITRSEGHEEGLS